MPAAETVFRLYLKAVRRAAGVTMRDAAKQLRVSVSTISRTERGQVPLTGAKAARWLRACGLPPHTALERLARETLHGETGGSGRNDDTPQRGHSFLDTAPGARERLALCHAEAKAVTTYTTHLIPAPYRTPEYDCAARELPAPVPPAQPSPLPLHAPVPELRRQTMSLLLDERVLLVPTGTPAVMAAQLEHLINIMDRESAHVQVLSRNLLHTKLPPPISELEMPDGTRLLTGTDPRPWYMSSGTGLLVAAPPANQDETRQLLLDAARAMHERSAKAARAPGTQAPACRPAC